jgi:Holliday junction resolvase RusA-like endonuclease
MIPNSLIWFKCPGHPVETMEEDVTEELHAYYKHLSGKHDYRIDINPKPTPRPRATARKIGNRYIAQVYNPTDYTKYKERLSILMRDASLGLRRGDYKAIFLKFGIPYNQTERKKNVTEGTPHRKQFDIDNLCKAVLDAMQQANIIEDDRSIYKISATKVGTHSQGYISFNII